MMLKILFCTFAYITIILCDRVFNITTDYPAVVRNRIFRFAIYQDILVALSILKMIVIEGYSVYGVVDRIRSSGLVTRAYVATSVVLHGVLLFDEATNHRVRLTPVPYLPPTIDEYTYSEGTIVVLNSSNAVGYNLRDQRDLFLL